MIKDGFEEINYIINENLESLIDTKPQDMSIEEFLKTALEDQIKMKILREHFISPERTVSDRLRKTMQVIRSYPYFIDLELQAYMKKDGQKMLIASNPESLKEELKGENVLHFDILDNIEMTIKVKDLLNKYSKWLLSHYIDTLKLQIWNAARYEEESTTDSLTKLGNRRLFDDHLQRFFQAEREKVTDGMALMIIDFDNLKQINDNHPLLHTAGDILLKGGSAILKNSMGKNRDLIYRIGGDEFAILMLMSSYNTAKNKAETIRENIKKHKFLPSKEDIEIGYLRDKFLDGEYPVIESSVSIGVSHTDYAGSPEDLFQDADRRMYLEKQEKKR